MVQNSNTEEPERLGTVHTSTTNGMDDVIYQMCQANLVQLSSTYKLSKANKLCYF